MSYSREPRLERHAVSPVRVIRLASTAPSPSSGSAAPPPHRAPQERGVLRVPRIKGTRRRFRRVMACLRQLVVGALADELGEARNFAGLDEQVHRRCQGAMRRMEGLRNCLVAAAAGGTDRGKPARSCSICAAQTALAAGSRVAATSVSMLKHRPYWSASRQASSPATVSAGSWPADCRAATQPAKSRALKPLRWPPESSTSPAFSQLAAMNVS
jgi:hypothetical protein